ncbi:MAG: error-prone DNA polymerase [Acidimicrobiales bacterium]
MTERHPYAELHCHSNFSFLDGASHPEELAGRAAQLGLDALALTDHHGLYGVVRFALATQAAGVRSVFGAELTLAHGAPRTGVPDPPGSHLVVLASDPEGYARLSRAIADAHLAGGEKGKPTCTLDDLAGRHGGHWTVLTGCRKGAVPSTLVSDGPSAAARALERLVDVFGRDRVVVELWDHGDPLDTARNDALAVLATRAGVQIVATNNVHYHGAARRHLAEVLAAVRAGEPLAELQGWLPPAAAATLRSGAEQHARFARWPGACHTAAEIGAACSFDLALLAPGLPDFPVPPGHGQQSWLEELVHRGAQSRYGPRHAERVRGAWAQIDHELEVIGALGFAGYFLIVWDIVEFCRHNNIYCQGRGSAANSAVCYALGITRADAVSLGLLFERFLSPERDGPPDIDVDIESGRREEVIAYVYDRYGRQCAAQVANVITYRARSAIRDVGKALGHSPAEVDTWAKGVDRGDPLDTGGTMPPLVATMAAQVLDFPRHLGLHSGGMVICDRPVVEVCPVEWARHRGRSALQWDKEDCAAAGLVKFDLLGLGMLDALHRAVDLVRSAHEVDIDLATVEQEDAVYDMLCRADTVGVFQVESRAQMATLPRIKPRTFADLVIEVAIIRPGPIQGGSVHPYIRRRQGLEPPDPPHPLLERALHKTLGVPLFQEQLMQIAIDAAGFTGAEADELRQAMGAKRSSARMAKLRDRLFAGMAARGITGGAAESIFAKLSAFSSFGFPESHAVSFAYLVYASAWLKLHYPAAFCAALLNAQPMGFWSPQSLVADARRHGVVVRRPHVNASEAKASLEWDDEPFDRAREESGQPAVRLGIMAVRGVGEELATRIARGRPYDSVQDLVRRVEPGRPVIESLAGAGALADLPGRPGGRSPDNRRSALWSAGALAQGTPDRLPGIVTGEDAPAFDDLTPAEELHADLWATGITTDGSVMALARSELEARGVVTAAALAGAETDGRVTVAGVVTHRQQPDSAGGTVFINLEDDTGMVNVICSRGAWVRWRHVARRAPALLVRGRIERTEGAPSVVAETIEALALPGLVGLTSRDFH